jgi:uncharacterized membrane protein YGL010W
MLSLLLTIYVVSTICMLASLVGVFRRENYLTLRDAAGVAFFVIIPVANTIMTCIVAWHLIQDWLDWADGIVVWRRK